MKPGGSDTTTTTVSIVKKRPNSNYRTGLKKSSKKQGQRKDQEITPNKDTKVNPMQTTTAQVRNNRQYNVWPGRVTSFTYDTQGRQTSRTGMTYGNGLVLTRQFDQDGRLTAQEITGSATVQSLQFTYNAADNLINKTNLADSTKSQTYGYDALDRLTSAQGSYGNIGYGYDAIGNRLTRSQGTVNETYAYAAASNRLVSVDDGTSQTAYQFDANGNTTAKGAEQFVYNPENRLKEYRGPTTATYVYNAQGQRTAKQTATGTMRYVYNQQGQLLGEYGNNTSKEYVYLDGEPLAIIDNNQIYYVHNDHLATPQQMTDQNQAVVWAVDYKPFGEVTTTTNTVENNLRFPGQYYDSENGEHYNWNRYYDPRTGRYITSDPIGLAGGPNTYLYSNANPLNLVDTYGTCPTTYKTKWSGTRQSGTIIRFTLVLVGRYGECSCDVTKVLCLYDSYSTIKTFPSGRTSEKKNSFVVYILYDCRTRKFDPNSAFSIP
jgi:RHS repeat-associated protein